MTVSKRRHALSDNSVRAATVLSSWTALEGVIDEEQVVSVFRDKKRRLKKSDTPNMYVDVSDDDIL